MSEDLSIGELAELNAWAYCHDGEYAVTSRRIRIAVRMAFAYLDTRKVTPNSFPSPPFYAWTPEGMVRQAEGIDNGWIASEDLGIGWDGESAKKENP